MHGLAFRLDLIVRTFNNLPNWKMDSEREKENDPGVTMLDVLQENLCQLDFLDMLCYYFGHLFF